MRVLYLKEKSRSGDRSYRGGVRRESPLGEVGIRGKSRSGEVAIRRSLLQGRSRSGEVAIGGSWHQGEVAIGRSLLQGRCQERGRHWGKLVSGGSRDREIAPTGEVSGESPLGEVGIYGQVAIGRSLLQGRCQEREVAIGGSWHQGEVAIGRSRDQEIAPTREVAIGRSRDREIAPTGEVSGESRHRGKLASGGSRDREIAPTGEVSGESRHWGKLAFMEKVAIGRSLLQKI